MRVPAVNLTIGDAPIRFVGRKNVDFNITVSAKFLGQPCMVVQIDQILYRSYDRQGC